MFGMKKTENGKKVCKLGKVLVAVDNSDASFAAACFAIAMAAEHHCAVAAVYVVDTESMDYLLNLKILVSTEKEALQEQLEENGQHLLARLTEKAKEAGIEFETALEHGVFHKTILAQAKAHGANAIIVSGWHRTITRKDRPSVERQLILDEAECPVIVVKETPGAELGHPSEP